MTAAADLRNQLISLRFLHHTFLPAPNNPTSAIFSSAFRMVLFLLTFDGWSNEGKRINFRHRSGIRRYLHFIRIESPKQVTRPEGTQVRVWMGGSHCIVTPTEIFWDMGSSRPLQIGYCLDYDHLQLYDAKKSHLVQLLKSCHLFSFEMREVNSSSSNLIFPWSLPGLLQKIQVYGDIEGQIAELELQSVFGDSAKLGSLVRVVPGPWPWTRKDAHLLCSKMFRTDCVAQISD